MGMTFTPTPGGEYVAIKYPNCIFYNFWPSNSVPLPYTKKTLKQNKKCALSGIDLIFEANHGKIEGNISLDRIDSQKGYTINNVQWVHKDINFMKQDFAENYFLDM